MKDIILTPLTGTRDAAIDRFVDVNVDITEFIYSIIQKKGITQKQLAEQLGKKESEISKILSGMHNLTLKTIAKIEIALGEKVIMVASDTYAENVLDDATLRTGIIKIHPATLALTSEKSQRTNRQNKFKVTYAF